jgi:predicted ABC-type ATPase
MKLLRFNQINEEHSKNDPMPELKEEGLGIVLVGAPGAGKTTFAKNEIMPRMRNVKHFSTDDVSRLLGGGSKEYRSGSSRVNNLRLQNYLESGQNFIYDTTAAGDRTMYNLVDSARDKGYKILFIHIIVDLETSKRQNKERAESGGHNVDNGYIEMAYKRQFSNMKSFETIFSPLAYYIVMNHNGKYKYMKIENGRLLKRKVDKYIPR